jgi:hypothetical protein
LTHFVTLRPNCPRSTAPGIAVTTDWSTKRVERGYSEHEGAPQNIRDVLSWSSLHAVKLRVEVKWTVDPIHRFLERLERRRHFGLPTLLGAAGLRNPRPRALGWAHASKARAGEP